MKKILIVLFYLMSVTRAEVIGSNEIITVVVGDDAILSCKLERPFNETISVSWRCNGTTVHLYRSRADDLSDQDKNFKDRTSLFPEEFAKGNFSLKLTNVTELDAGNYTGQGRVKDFSGIVLKRKCNVTLIVETESSKEIPPNSPETDQRKENPTNSPGEHIASNNGTDIGTGFLTGFLTGFGTGFLIGIGFCIWKHHTNSKTKSEPEPEPEPEPELKHNLSPRRRGQHQEKNYEEMIRLKKKDGTSDAST